MIDMRRWTYAFRELHWWAGKSLPMVYKHFDNSFMSVLKGNAERLRPDTHFQEERRLDVQEESKVQKLSGRSGWMEIYAAERKRQDRQMPEANMVDHLKSDGWIASGRDMGFNWSLVLDDPTLWEQFLAWEFNWASGSYEKYQRGALEREVTAELEETGEAELRPGRLEELLGSIHGRLTRYPRTARSVATLGPVRETKHRLIDENLNMGGGLNMPSTKVSKDPPTEPINGSWFLGYLKWHWWLRMVLRNAQRSLGIRREKRTIVRARRAPRGRADR
jgi:hypothetical protein